MTATTSVSDDGKNVIGETVKKQDALQLVKNYTYWSMGAGLIPIPLVDMAAVTGVQVKMIAEISSIYRVEFSENKVKAIVSSLLGSILPGELSHSSARALMWHIPLVGPVLSGFSMSVCSGAATYAVGRLFVNHFESGGNLLSFDIAKKADEIQEALSEGQTVASKMQDKKK